MFLLIRAGWRTSQEDAHLVAHDIDSQGTAIFGVFDGHGGREVRLVSDDPISMGKLGYIHCIYHPRGFPNSPLVLFRPFAIPLDERSSLEI